MFFVIEKLVLWWHREADEADAGGNGPRARTWARRTIMPVPGLRRLVLVRGRLHNALDGVLIAAAFLTDVSLGLVTTFAVAAHEIPHSVGDFAVLVQAGGRSGARWC